MAQNFRVNESRNTLWIGIALLAAAAVVLLALAAQDFPGSGDRSRAESVTTSGTVPVLTEAGMPFPPYTTSDATSGTVPVLTEAGMPFPPYTTSDATSGSASELPWATYRDRVVPERLSSVQENAAGISQATYQDFIVPNASLVPGIGNGPETGTSQAAYEDFMAVEAALLAESSGSPVAVASAGTYLDRITGDASLVPSLHHVQPEEEYAEMPWTTPASAAAHRPSILDHQDEGQRTPISGR